MGAMLGMLLGAAAICMGAPAMRRGVSPNPKAAGWASLFADDAALDDALAGVDVFKFAINCVTNQFAYCALPDWPAAFAALRKRGVRVAIEANVFNTGMSVYPLRCDGAAAARSALERIRLLTDAGERPDQWVRLRHTLLDFP